MKISSKANQQSRIQMIFFLTVVLIIVLFLIRLPRLSAPLVVAYIMSLVLNQLTPFFSRLKISRNFSMAIILFGLIFLIVYPFIKFFPSIKEELNNFQFYIPKIEKAIREFYLKWSIKVEKIAGYKLDGSIFEDSLTFAQETIKNFVLKIPNFLASLVEWVFLIPLFLFFMVRDGKQFRRLFLKLVPNAYFERIYYLIYKFNKQLGDYIFAKFIEASIIGTITILGLLILNVKFAFILGVAAAITNIIPYVGPVLGAIPGIIVCLAQYGGGPVLGGVIILYAVANILDLGFVFPILVSKIVNMHPIIVVISVILGSQYMGIIGMIISIPLAAIGKLIFGEIYKEIYPVISRQNE